MNIIEIKVVFSCLIGDELPLYVEELKFETPSPQVCQPCID